MDIKLLVHFSGYEADRVRRLNFDRVMLTAIKQLQATMPDTFPDDLARQVLIDTLEDIRLLAEPIWVKLQDHIKTTQEGQE